jgi:hypothetical protein
MPLKNQQSDTKMPTDQNLPSAHLKRHSSIALLLGMLLLLAFCVQKEIRSRVELDKQLITAVKQSDVEKVKSLLAQGASPNAHQVRTWELSGVEKEEMRRKKLNLYPTPSVLHVACGLWDVRDVDYQRVKHLHGFGAIPSLTVDPFHHNPAIIKLLVDAGADVNELRVSGPSILSSAARWMDVDTLEYLIKKGAKVNDYRGGSSALMLALIGMDRDRSEIVEVLLKHGADPNKESPLTLIVVPNRLNYVHLLVKYGANINATNDKGETLLRQMKRAVKEETFLPPSQDVIDLLEKMGAKDEVVKLP